ncbi:MAG: 4-hydroxy-tetrahydrodipicolinate synthase [Colwellia sp.]|nr:4-hydroxy-tetrahydrodipicolinate synthase [Colwellia sp.]
MNQNISINNSPVASNVTAVSDCQLWTALITPFHQNGSIDFDSLAEITKAQVQAGNGILLLGSTGEGLALTNDEQFSIVEFVCKLQNTLSIKSPLMVAVGGYNLSEQINWINRCNELDIHSYLLGTPLYAKPGEAGQTQWFKALLDAAKFPCMLYNVPSRSGVEIPVATIQNLQDHPNCWAMKEASGDLNNFLNYRQQCPNIDIYTGEDAMLPYLIPAGVKGLVSVSGNVWPKATKSYVELCLDGQTQTMFPVWNNAVDALFSVANPIAVKALMHEKKAISTPALRAPLTHIELTDNTALLAIDEQINQWLAQASQTSFS